MASAEEDNFWGKMALDSIPENADEVVIDPATGYDMGAAGLAGVWATRKHTRGPSSTPFTPRGLRDHRTAHQPALHGGWNFRRRTRVPKTWLLSDTRRRTDGG